ncbi:MAG: hypothetical protein KAH10_06510 [Flavobacteriales bacterium]|nr:hypothetical protein [Flavobacteriales bacterium]
MLVRVFDNTRPITVIVLYLLLLGVVASSFYVYFSIPEYQDKYLIHGYFPYLGDVMAVSLSTFIVLSLAILVNYIVHDNAITRKNSFALLFFVLLVASYPAIVILNPILVATFFVVLSLKNLLSLHEHKKMTVKLFNAGLFIGMAAVVYPYSLLYIVLIYLGIIIYGADNWRQWLLPLLGVLIPYYLLFTGYFVFDQLPEYFDRFFIHSFQFRENHFYDSKWVALVWGTYMFITIFAIFEYSSNINLHKLDTRKGYSMTYLALFIGVIIAMFGTHTNGQELIILFLPTSIIWAKFLQHKKKALWQNVFMLIVFSIVVVSYVANYSV